MAVGAADIHKAVNRAWSDYGLDWQFKQNWSESLRDEFITLNETEAAPNQPWPYCVYEQDVGSVVTRMTSTDKAKKREIRDFPFAFRVYSQPIAGSAKKAKVIAADLVEEILKVFGGHPSVEPQNLTLDNGNFLIAQYQNDFSARVGDTEWVWTINYILRTDVPVMV